MATLSRNIMLEIAKLRREYLDAGNFGASSATDLADQHVDGIDKLHLPPVEFFDTVIDRFTVLLQSEYLEAEEKESLARILEEIVVPQKENFLHTR